MKNIIKRHCLKSHGLKAFSFSGATVLLLSLVLLSNGCSSLDLQSMTELAKFEKKPEFETPLQVIPVWSDTVLHQAGKPGTRGFGGRVLFYGENKEKSIRVDGTLIVYAWDDTAEVANRKADRKYVFRADKLQDHYSNSKIGHSYNFWIPWDAAGGEQERVSLIIRFIGTNGAEVNSEPTSVILPGPIKKPESMLAKKGRNNPSSRSTGAARKVIEDSRLLPATHETVYAEPAAVTDGASIQQTTYTRQQEAARPVHTLQTSEIPLTNGFIERNMQAGEIGFSSDELFAPQEKETSRLTQKTAGSPIQQTGRENQTNEQNGLSGQATRSSIRSQPFQSRVQTARATPQFRGRVRREPLPAKSLNGLPQTPRSESRVAP